MHYIYGFCDGNARAAQREYGIRYPDRVVPSSQVFTRLHQRLLETGSVKNIKKEVGPNIDVFAEEDILARVEDNPEISTRRLAADTGLSRWKVSQILKDNTYHPYHFTQVQSLEPNDYEARMVFCRWLLNRDIEEYHFLKKILWTDEARFDQEGVFNYHNMHVWATENPRAMRESSFQHRFSLNVWAGVVDDVLVGPHFFEGNLTGVKYLDFLQHNLPQLLDQLTQQQREELIFQQDGAPPHFTNDVRQWLTENYPIWIGRGGTVAWPPRSPDLTPLDFYVWGYMKSEVYKTVVRDENDLRNRIIEAANKVRNELTFNVSVRAIRKRARACVRENGGQFEHKIK